MTPPCAASQPMWAHTHEKLNAPSRGLAQNEVVTAGVQRQRDRVQRCIDAR